MIKQTENIIKQRKRDLIKNIDVLDEKRKLFDK